jgi:hypothetical protein
MLDLDAVENRNNKSQLILTLHSIRSGLRTYAKVCRRQVELGALQRMWTKRTNIHITFV